MFNKDIKSSIFDLEMLKEIEKTLRTKMDPDKAHKLFLKYFDFINSNLEEDENYIIESVLRKRQEDLKFNEEELFVLDKLNVSFDNNNISEEDQKIIKEAAINRLNNKDLEEDVTNSKLGNVLKGIIQKIDMN